VADLQVRQPGPKIWTGDAAKKHDEATRQHANVPQRNYQPFVTGNAGIPLLLEPPNAQQIYAVLDTVMQKVLTEQGSDIDRLLADAEQQVNSILAAVK
jgi:multiple sugar transport system substrate-binding protein